MAVSPADDRVSHEEQALAPRVHLAVIHLRVADDHAASAEELQRLFDQRARAGLAARGELPHPENAARAHQLHPMAVGAPSSEHRGQRVTDVLVQLVDPTLREVRVDPRMNEDGVADDGRALELLRDLPSKPTVQAKRLPPLGLAAELPVVSRRYVPQVLHKVQKVVVANQVDNATARLGRLRAQVREQRVQVAAVVAPVDHVARLHQRRIAANPPHAAVA
mmetsp:Transcript_51330/g.156012  ORF Transcript_51330/g.156012 Transcript_51330/m.156012 type:complete len:221 (+) Transcript_51330:234-896(+)